MLVPNIQTNTAANQIQPNFEVAQTVKQRVSVYETATYQRPYAIT
jgi:hypothetical protein